LQDKNKKCVKYLFGKKNRFFMFILCF